jgi:hypothetical protein
LFSGGRVFFALSRFALLERRVFFALSRFALLERRVFFALSRFALLERIDRAHRRLQSRRMSKSPTLLLLLSTALLSGCDRIYDSHSQLVGGWAPSGAACDSPGGVVYNKEGVWAGYDVSGRWKLDGDRLTTWVTERGGFDEPGRKVSEKPSTSIILALSQTDLTLRLADGSTQMLKRCRR